MSQKLTPAIKGLITGVLMLATSFALYYSNIPLDSSLMYLVYGIFGAGIVWTLISYKKNINPSPKFSQLFGQGFRCFIVVTLIMVAFTGFYTAANPEIAKTSAGNYRKDLQDQKSQSKTPAEIEEAVARFEKQYTVQLMSFAVFQFLILGTIITAACSVFLIARKQ